MHLLSRRFVPRALPSLLNGRRRLGPGLLLVPLLAWACGEPAAPPPPAAAAAKREVVAPLSIKTTSYPADLLARRLAPSGAMVSLILPAGEDPPHWQPPGALVSSLAEADLIVANGAGFEAWMATAALPESKLVRAADGVPTIAGAATTHSHGPAGAHSHGAVDQHHERANVVRDLGARAAPRRAFEKAPLALNPTILRRCLLPGRLRPPLRCRLAGPRRRLVSAAPTA
jgi:hypothetical protein